MNKKELNDFFESISLDATGKDKVLEKILKGETDMKYAKKRMSAALVIVLILALSTLTVLASTLGWHEKLIEYFRPTEEQMEYMEDNVSFPQATATDNGVTVNVLQTVMDKHEIYVLCELIAPENTVLTEDIDLKHWHLTLLSQDNPDTYNMSTGSYKVLERKDNRMTMLIQESADTSLMKDQTLALHLTDLSRIIENGDPSSEDYTAAEETVVSFQLNLSWTANYTDLTKVYDVNQPVVINGQTGYTLNQIEISPISVWIFIEGPGSSSMSAVPVIKMNDGSVISVRSEDENAYYTFAAYIDPDKQGGKTSIHYIFDHITDIEDIESITVGDRVIKID
mgnify:CR=1 FL=1